MRCSVCGERVPEGANFCPACGAMLREGAPFINEADACEAAAYAMEEAFAAREALDSLSDSSLRVSIEDGRAVWNDVTAVSSEPTTVMRAAVNPTVPMIVRAEPPAAPEVELQAPIEVAETTAWPAAAILQAADDARDSDALSEG